VTPVDTALQRRLFALLVLPVRVAVRLPTEAVNVPLIEALL
jgi:hypothetical protein